MASVLIVDDEPDTAETIQMGLEMAGFTCWIAKESVQALKTLQENQPDVAFVDVRLDGSPLDGLGILQEARSSPSRPGSSSSPGTTTRRRRPKRRNSARTATSSSP